MIRCISWDHFLPELPPKSPHGLPTDVVSPCRSSRGQQRTRGRGRVAAWGTRLPASSRRARQGPAPRPRPTPSAASSLPRQRQDALESRLSSTRKSALGRVTREEPEAALGRGGGAGASSRVCAPLCKAANRFAARRSAGQAHPSRPVPGRRPRGAAAPGRGAGSYAGAALPAHGASEMLRPAPRSPRNVTRTL